jgi:zinc protease
MPEMAASDQVVRRAQLDNGLTVLVREVHTAPLVSVWCWYRVGSRDDGAGHTGAAHFVEHLNFKGSTNIPRDQVKGLVERFGGAWNAYTWVDQTAYFETAARDALDRLLFIEAERMGSCLYDPDDCESERTVIVSELKGSENDPDQLLEMELTSTAIAAHPYRHPTIGWLPDIHAITRDDLYAHYRRFYGPNHATLVVAGDARPDDVIRLADRHFGSIAPVPDAARPRVIEPPPRGERRVLLEREGTTAYMKIAWHSPALGDPTFLPTLVLDAILTGAKGLNLWASFRTPPPQRRARLYRALVERGLASSVSGALLPTQDPFLYTISATANTGVSRSAVEEAALEELSRVVSGGVSDEEVERARRQLRARFVFETDSVTNLAHQIGFFETVATLDLFDDLTERTARVTAEEVAAAARACLASPGRTVGWFVPVAAPGSGHPAGGGQS